MSGDARERFVKGEFCGPCYREDHGKVPATRKVEEVTIEPRHPYTQYVCENCFGAIMGPRVAGRS